MDFAREERVSWGQLLGLMMAHEIGHLLLGTNSHSPVGIMRAQWGPGEIEGALMGTLTFTREQSARVRVDVQRRHDVR